MLKLILVSKLMHPCKIRDEDIQDFKIQSLIYVRKASAYRICGLIC
jgi:hypothetical protein